MQRLNLIFIALIIFSLVNVIQLTASDSDDLLIYTEEYPPLNYSDQGKLTGLSVEIVKEIQNRVGNETPLKVVKWEDGYNAVLGKGNVALFTTVMTAERKDKMQWVGPIAVFQNNIYAPAGSGVKVSKLADLKKNQTIATVKDYYSESILKDAGFTNLVEYANEETALRKMLEGETSLFVGNSATLPVTMREAGTKPENLEKVINASTNLAYIAFSLDTPVEIINKWQTTLDKMKDDGTFAKIYTKWLPTETLPGKLIMMTEEYPPVTFMKDGKPSGFATDMVREISARLNISADIYLTDWNNAYQMAVLHPNVVLFSTERTYERDPLFYWIGPVGKTNSILYKKKGTDLQIEDLDEAREVKAIATITDWFTEQYLVNEGFTNLLSSKTPEESIENLMNGKAQLAVFTDLTISDIISHTPYSMADLEPVFVLDQTYSYIAISKDTDPRIAESWEKTLNDMKADGTFAEIYHRYLPEAEMTGLIKN